ncbi:MAG: hypothetical protein ABI193_18800, partial [Minicystis sp.]
MRRSVAWGLALVTMAVGTSCHLLVGVEDVVLDPSTSSTSSTSSTTSTTSTTSTSSTTSTGGGGSSSTTSTTSTSTTTTTSTSGTGGAGGSGGAGGGATTCTALPTLVAHWDPASLLLADGDPVITWMGGNFLDLTQSDPTLRPTYKAAAINGQPALLFDGTPAKLTSLNGD